MTNFSAKKLILFPDGDRISVAIDPENDSDQKVTSPDLSHISRYLEIERGYPIFRIIGLYLVELRQKRNLSVQELADALGVSCSAIYKWEKGIGASISSLSQVASMFGMTYLEMVCSAYRDLYTKETNGR